MGKYWPEKDSNSIEPFFVVWCDITGTNTSGDNGELQGATISSATWTVPTGVTKVSDNLNAVTIDGVSYSANTVCTVWLSGGTAGADPYEVLVRIVTSDGRTLDQTGMLVVVNK